MIELVKPRGFIPVHGTLHHLSRHAALARDLGVPEVCVLENGDVAHVDAEGMRKGEHVHSGRVHVFAGRALPASVVNERVALAARGEAHVVVPVDALGSLTGDLVLTTHGVVDGTLDGGLLATVRREAHVAVEQLSETTQDGTRRATPPCDEEIAEAARQAIRRAFGRVLGFKPVTTATVLRVER
jgi:ribonuclease J